MSFDEEFIKKEKILDFGPCSIKENPNSEEQIKVLSHLLERAMAKKLDILGVVWDDEDQGKSAYCDFYDYPGATLCDMLSELEEVVAEAAI